MASAETSTALILRDVRRGDAPDVLEFTTLGGDVLLVHAHGVHADEQWRVRERLLKLLAGALQVAENDPAREAFLSTLHSGGEEKPHPAGPPTV